MRKIKRFLSALLCGAILITGTLAGVSVRTDAAASSYAVQLRAAGFPDSYIRALSALHTAYPQWQFQAVKTGLDWNTVVSKESVNGVNLVPKTGNDATKSTADGAYDWTTNVWPSSWGTQKTVAVDGYGVEALNTYGQHYWMLDVQMDCSKAVNGLWFEFKTYIKNGAGWEANVSQSGTPYTSGNHFAQCGKVNVFQRGVSAPVSIHDFP